MSYWGNEAAGVILFDVASKKFGLGRRSSMVNEPGTLGSFGGAIENGDSPTETIENELMEEIGYFYPAELRELPVFEDTEHGFRYHNFIAAINMSEFKPVMNWENDGIEWFSFSTLKNSPPGDLHFGVRWLLDQESTFSAMKQIIKKHSPDAGVELRFG